MRDFRMLGGCVKMSFHHDSFLYVNVLWRIFGSVRFWGAFNSNSRIV